MKSILLNTILIVSILFNPTKIIAQETEKSIKLISNGIGKTLEEAKSDALRSAIEQASGAFISSKTELLNDKIVVDQIISVANGIVQSFEIMNESIFPDGTVGVTLKTFVVVSKLSGFMEAKGLSVEIQGSLFAMNIKQQLLNEQGEINIISEMVGLLHEPMQLAFDYEIKTNEPKSLDGESKNWEIPIEVTAIGNKNMDLCANYLIKTLAALDMSTEEIETYKSANKIIYSITVKYKNNVKMYSLRKRTSIDVLNAFLIQFPFYARLFKTKTGEYETMGSGKINFYNYESEHKYENYDRSNYTDIGINFKTSGETVAVFSWNETKTLTQIEKMTDYSVKPYGIYSRYKYGGYVIYEKNGHGLVIDIYDLGKHNFINANKACAELETNGFKDWRLPSIEELNLIYKMAWYGNGGFDNNPKNRSGNSNTIKYWSSTKGMYNGRLSKYIAMGIGETSTIEDEESEINTVRAVRNF